jgi:preprotein translocase subunit SecE
VAKKQAAKDKKGPSDQKAEVKKSSAAPAVESQGFNLVDFAVSAKEELAKVAWPSRQQLISESAAVLLMVSLSAGIIYFVDKFLSWASTQVFG